MCSYSPAGLVFTDTLRTRVLRYATNSNTTVAQDFASHVGHTVTVHGTFANGADASNSASATSSGGMSASNGQQFVVSKLDMVSESCTKEKGKTKEKESDNSYSKPNPNHK